MSEEIPPRNTTASTAAAATSKLDVLLLAVSMAAPSPRRSTLASAANIIKTAVEPSISAAAATEFSSLLPARTKANTSATRPSLITPPSTIELLDDAVTTSSTDLPIFTENSSAPKIKSSTQSIFTSSLPAPKIMTKNSHQNLFTNSLPIKKRYTYRHREGGSTVTNGTLSDGSANVQDHNVATTQAEPLPVQPNVIEYPAPPMMMTMMNNSQNLFTSLPMENRFFHRSSERSSATLQDGNVIARHQVAALPTLETATPPPLNNDSSTTTNNKKEKKKYRKPLCSQPSCPNRVMNRGVCARHGARVRICSVEHCTKYAQKGGVCIRHGAKKEYKRCSVEGCNSRGSTRRPLSGMNVVCSRHASSSNTTCLSVGTSVAAVAADRGNGRQNEPQEEVRQDASVRIDEEEPQKQQARDTIS